MTRDTNEIEKKRQKKRQESKIYKVEENNKPKFYILDMFPYPSGAGLHVGHPKGYVASDTLARKKMLEGFNVLHPMGFDTFGLGTEQYAIDNKMKPQDVAKKNIDYYIQQLEKIGFSYDRERSFSTADPDYYKRTQRIFLQFYTHYYDENQQKALPISLLADQLKKEGNSECEISKILDQNRLAYIDYKPINRCPHCQTGLANEDLEDGKCERCGSDVEQKPMRQRVLRISKYADRLIDGLNDLDWDESMKELERNWIGKSTGTQFKMKIENSENFLEVYTTRIDTVFGMSFVAIAPEHPLLDEITSNEYKSEVQTYKDQAKLKTQLERTELQKDKSGVFCGAYVINPFNNEKIPVYVADYVLANYGTGVVMAVPAHDERDFEFAQKYNLPITQSIAPLFGHSTPAAKWRDDKPVKERNIIYAIIHDPKTDKYLISNLLTGETGHSLIVGGRDDGESVEETALREIREETGYKNLKHIKTFYREIHAKFFAIHKDENRIAKAKTVVFDLISNEQDEIDPEELKRHEVLRLSKDEVQIRFHNQKYVWGQFTQGEAAFTEKGVLVDSGEFSGLQSDEAMEKMQARLTQKEIGGKKSNYKIQDRVFSRQRYWGEPFPVVFCEECGKKEIKADFEINFYHQPSREGIKKGIKTIETRALNPDEPDRYFGNSKIGNIIQMNNKETGEILFAQIKKKYQRKNFEELFNFPLLEKIYSNPEQFLEVKNADILKSHWDFTPGYREKIEKNGLIGREIELLTTKKVIPLFEKDLPLILPDVDNYQPTGREEGPLADIDRWINTTCPVCGSDAKRESNTMPGWAGSSRYWLRYMDPKNTQQAVAPQKEQYWKNVDVYVGGAEHVTRHMIYARFWQKFLFDIGVVTQQEPFQRYEKVGLIMAEDGRKMSKRRNNVVNPDDIIAEYGADTFRTYEMFMGPFDQFISRNTNGLKGVKKFLDKIIALYEKNSDEKDDSKTETLLHQSIKKATEDIDTFKFNTTISNLMILVNHLTDQPHIHKKTFESLIILIAPFAPHLAEEFWEKLGNEYSIFTKASWPTYDENKLTADSVKIAVQYNGKVRGTIELSPSATQDEALSHIRSDERLREYLSQGEIKKVIYIPGKIINLMIG